MNGIVNVLKQVKLFGFSNNVISFIQMLATINTPKVQAPLGVSLLHLVLIINQSIIFILINHIQWYREDIHIHITKCDNITIGDEYHYIMECDHFSNFRNRFIVTNLRERPNILKFKQIMSAYEKQNLEKLCKFIRKINKSFVL